MFYKTLAGVALASAVVMSSSSLAAGKVMITPDLYSFEVMHEGKLVEVMRNQDPENVIHELYNTTFRGMPQPMHPFEPYEVETIAEREFVGYMMRAKDDPSVLIVDTRTVGWNARLTIPGSVSYPYTLMDDEDDALDTLEEFGAVRQADGNWDFSKAKTLALFCNGYWCGQTPQMVRKLLEYNYPADKLKYYRGGMQAWTSLGFTVVGEAAPAK